MASERQIKANRENAQRSTGPKTAGGKARSRQNAFRHGLSRPSQGDDSAAVAKPVKNPLSIAGLKQDTRPDDLTHIVQARLELMRIRAVRHELLAVFLDCPDPKLAKRLRSLERYERAAYARQTRNTRR